MYNQIDSNKRKTVLLMTIFVIVILLLGWLIGEVSGYGYYGLIIATVISVLMSFTSYFGGDKVALASTGAKEIQKQDNPYVYRMVENLCITAGLPRPKVYINDDPALNAFATGRDPEHASIALTTGIINALENEELEGVIAHELSHVKNYDIRIMMVVIVLVGIVIILSDFLMRAHFFKSRDRDNNAGGILIIAGIILAILSPLFAQLIQLAISRKREFLADASGALLTRYPEGLARALEKISSDARPLSRASKATAHLFIANPFKGSKKVMSKLFSTHPPVEQRIAALRKMA